MPAAQSLSRKHSPAAGGSLSFSGQIKLRSGTAQIRLEPSGLGWLPGGGCADGIAVQEPPVSGLQQAETPPKSSATSEDPQVALGALVLQLIGTFVGEQHVPPT
jgi:hypothetical protein